MNLRFAFLLNFLFLVPFQAATAANEGLAPIRCAFTISGAPFATLEFGYNEGGDVSSAVKVIHFGNAHSESLTAEARTERQLIHAIISKENPDNSLILEVFHDYKAQLTNPHVPDGFRIMPGSCQQLRSE